MKAFKLMYSDSQLSTVIFSGSSGAGNKSSNTGVIVGSVVGGCVLVALLVLAGMYAFRQKGRAERATHESSPFGINFYIHLTESFGLPSYI